MRRLWSALWLSLLPRLFKPLYDQSGRMLFSLALVVGAMSFLAFALIQFRGAENVAAGPPLPGAIFTTLPDGSAVNANIYTQKCDVSLNGGPDQPQALHLPDGTYDVAVTDPSGQTILGQGTATVTISNGEGTFGPTSLCSLVTPSPYDTTPNPGGEYKAWLCTTGNLFVNDQCKTDNFKVGEATATPSPTAVVETQTPTATPTGAATATPTGAATATPTGAATATPTGAATATPTGAATATPTGAATATPTEAPPTATPTEAPPTATPTGTLAPTPSPTAVLPLASPTPTAIVAVVTPSPTPIVAGVVATPVVAGAIEGLPAGGGAPGSATNWWPIAGAFLAALGIGGLVVGSKVMSGRR